MVVLVVLVVLVGPLLILVGLRRVGALAVGAVVGRLHDRRGLEQLGEGDPLAGVTHALVQRQVAGVDDRAAPDAPEVTRRLV
jgi:hypothetical protein